MISELFTLKGEDVDCVVFDAKHFAVYIRNSAVALSGDSRVCTVRASGDTESQHYITNLCPIPAHMRLISHALFMKNTLSPLLGSTTFPTLHKHLLPEGTPLLSPQVQSFTEAPTTPTTAHWAGCAVVESYEGITITASGEIAALCVLPGGGVFRVTYMAPVLQKPTESNSVHSIALCGLPAASPAQFVMVNEMHFVVDTLERKGLWLYPLLKCLGRETENTFPETRLPRQEEAALAYTAYPELLPIGFFSAANNVVSSLTSPTTPLCVYDRRKSSIFRTHSTITDTPLPAAVILHDLSTLTVQKLGGTAVYRLDGRPILTEHHLVRLREPSYLTGTGQFTLHEIVQYATVAQQCAPKIVERKSDAIGGGYKCLLEGIGEACVMGTKCSLRFEDRCILRADLAGGIESTATLLLPTGKTAEVRLNSSAFPEDLRGYCVTALEVFSSLKVL